MRELTILSAWLLLLVVSAAQAAASSGAASPPQIPERTWIVLPLPPRGQGIHDMDKHVTLAFNPLDRRMYMVGGDYQGSSYRQEVWSLDLAERLRQRDDPAAGWRLEYPHCGPAGKPQPKGPDFVGWTWDPKREVFWMVPGEMQPHGRAYVLCTGERPEHYGDDDGTVAGGPILLFRWIMQFDPRARAWRGWSRNAGRRSETWYSTHDPRTDTLIRMGREVQIYDIARDVWVEIPMRPNALGQTVLVSKEHHAADHAGRRIFMIDGYHGRLHRYDMDARRMEDLGPIPGGAILARDTHRPIENRAYLVWDSVSRVLIHYRYFRQGVYVYRPDAPAPRWARADLPFAPGSPISHVHWNGVAFDPANNLVVGIGEAGYVHLLRYGHAS